MAKYRGGRPSKFDQDRRDRLVQALKAGNFRQVACEYSGIDFSTFSRWMANGARSPNSEYGAFRKAILEAERQAEVGCVARVMKATETDWKAAAWWLERKRSGRWSRKEKLEHTGAGGGPIKANVKVLRKLSDDDLDKIQNILKTAAGSARDPAPASEETQSEQEPQQEGGPSDPD